MHFPEVMGFDHGQNGISNYKKKERKKEREKERENKKQTNEKQQQTNKQTKTKTKNDTDTGDVFQAWYNTYTLPWAFCAKAVFHQLN